MLVAVAESLSDVVTHSNALPVWSSSIAERRDQLHAFVTEFDRISDPWSPTTRQVMDSSHVRMTIDNLVHGCNLEPLMPSQNEPRQVCLVVEGCGLQYVNGEYRIEDSSDTNPTYAKIDNARLIVRREASSASLGSAWAIRQRSAGDLR